MVTEESSGGRPATRKQFDAILPEVSGALGRRRYSNPILVQPDAPERVLERVSFEEYEPGKIVGLDNSVEAPKTRVVDETRLQKLLFDYPGLLPISDIEPAFWPAIPLGREVGTANGPIDVLYISPQGYITIVETKLWRRVRGGGGARRSAERRRVGISTPQLEDVARQRRPRGICCGETPSARPPQPSALVAG